MIQYCLIIIAAALVGGAVPLFVGRSHRLVHGLIAISAGFFLGVVFTHLLPEVAYRASLVEQAGHAAEHVEGEDHEEDEHPAEARLPDSEDRGSRRSLVERPVGYFFSKTVVPSQSSSGGRFRNSCVSSSRRATERSSGNSSASGSSAEAASPNRCSRYSRRASS